jgi:putative ABC transport system permease protein
MILQSGHLAVWSVLRQRRRTAFALAAVAFGIAALILAGAFVEWIFWAAREGTIQNGLGHIHAARKGFHDKGTADLNRYLLPADSLLLQALRKSPGVKTVSPRLSFSGLVSHGDTTISFLAEGLDPDSEKKAGNVSIIVKGEDLSSDVPNGVIIGNGLASNLGVTIGDTVVLLANTPGGGINAVEASVRGLFSTVSKAYDDTALRVPLLLANQLLRISGAHRWVIVLTDTAHTPQALQEFSQRFAGSGIEFVPWYELADFYNKTVDLLSRQMGVIKLIIGLIIVLTISNSMMMGVMERTSEIGTAMALGTRERGILLQFVFEGLFLGILGGALGVVLGLGIAEVVSVIGIPMPPPPGQARAYRAGMIVTLPLVETAFVIAVATSVIAALYPAWKASRTNIIDALRHNR